MIRIILGNVGSGKTALIVREMLVNNNKNYYSNIITRQIKNNTVIEKSNIIKEEVIRIKKNGEPELKQVLNKEFWYNLNRDKSLNIVLDEAHTLINPRKSMSKINLIMGDFMALLRRVVGSNTHDYGELVLITQLERRLDVIAREMATVVQYVLGHYERHCKKCGKLLVENNETPNKLFNCPKCNKPTEKKNFIIEVFSFENIDKFHTWEVSRRRRKTYYNRYFVTDIEETFKHYNTLQWENLISD